MPRNQLGFIPFSSVLRKAWKQTATLLSQQGEQSMIRSNSAKSFQGLVDLVLSNLAASTLIRWFNRSEGSKLDNLKIPIASMHHGLMLVIFQVRREFV
jgi:hypothetical protein